MIGDARAAIGNVFWLPGTPILTRSSHCTVSGGAVPMEEDVE